MLNVVALFHDSGAAHFFCKNIRKTLCYDKNIFYICIVKYKTIIMNKGFILRVDFVEKFGFAGATLILVSFLADALEKGDGWLTLSQNEIAKMLGMTSARVNQIFRILKRDGFLLQKKASGRKFKNRKAYKFNEEKLK